MTDQSYTVKYSDGTSVDVEAPSFGEAFKKSWRKSLELNDRWSDDLLLSAKAVRNLSAADDQVSQAVEALSFLADLDLDQRIEAINSIRSSLHEVSPFKDEPVDFVRWVKSDLVEANDYNPNSVAPPEMELLKISIVSDGFTQPIVSSEEGGKFVVIDGFHRNRVSKECEEVSSKLHGYAPIVQIRSSQDGRSDRIASTIRHNRARGKHKVEAMSDIVVELKRRNWSDNRIAKELGMDQDEILRLCQITGLSEVFAQEEFSQAWDAAIFTEDDIERLTEDDVEALSELDAERIFHEWQDWECFPAGFYSDKPPKGMTGEECEASYRDFLANIPRFETALARVTSEWVNSCEHYLTNKNMNRIAWLGQASMCIETGVPSRFCGGYNLLTDEQKAAADTKALEYLNKWLEANGREPLSIDDAQPKTQNNLY